MKIPVVSFVGYSNSGKTTLIIEVLKELKTRGFRVATVKHHHKEVETDTPGKDTWKYAQAGADTVVLACPSKLTITERVPEEVSLDLILSKINNVDLVIVEGFKKEKQSKIEVTREDLHRPLIFQPEELLAVIAEEKHENVRTFSSKHIGEITDFLQITFGLDSRRKNGNG